MNDFLVGVGATYLLASVVILVGGYVEHRRRRKPVEFESIIKGLGLAGFFVWFPIGFALAFALVILPFVGAYQLIGWLSR